MSHRYIIPILSLSISSFLCGSESNASGSPIVPGNGSFSGLCCQLSRQGSGTYSEGPRTPLCSLDPNSLIAGTPRGPQKSELLDLLHNVFEMQGVVADEKFSNLNGTQRLGLQYRNQKIEDAIFSMIIYDNDLATVSIEARQQIAKIVVINIKATLMCVPQIWDHFSQDLKQRIIDHSTMVYTENNGFSRLLDDRITLEKLAAFSELENMRKNTEHSKRRHSFAAEDDSPLDPEAHLQILKGIKEETVISRSCGFNRYDSF
ncbi:MAG TPA: hypothetical protein DIC42_06590 [Holosporales bacterium]|nr:hypothetical protein [Holosporales bacterium]